MFECCGYGFSKARSGNRSEESVTPSGNYGQNREYGNEDMKVQDEKLLILECSQCHHQLRWGL